MSEPKRLDAEGLDPKTVYLEASGVHRYFLNWRERIFAGYVTVVAALGVAYVNVLSDTKRLAILGATIAASASFYILYQRNRRFISVSQQIAGEMEKTAGVAGPYARLDQILDDRKQGTLIRKRTTHGLAFNIIVSGVVVGAGLGIFRVLPRWAPGDFWKSLLPIGAALLIWVLLCCCLEWAGEKLDDPPPSVSPNK